MERVDAGRRLCLGCGRAHARGSIDRRRLLGLGLGGAALLAGGLRGAGASAAGSADALLLHCIDYRLTTETTNYMAERQLADKYDEVALAGAALGANTATYPDWAKTFWEHVQVAIDLHDIRRIIVMDHRDCGAYTVIFGVDFARDPVKEYEVHAWQLRALRYQIGQKYPKLAVELLLMDLDGKVETVG